MWFSSWSLKHWTSLLSSQGYSGGCGRLPNQSTRVFKEKASNQVSQGILWVLLEYEVSGLLLGAIQSLYNHKAWFVLPAVSSTSFQ